MSTQLAFDRLKGRENYATWKIGARAHLITKGLWDSCETTVTLSSSETVRKDDMKALAELTLLIDSSVYTHIENSLHAKEGWDALKNAFEDKGVGRKVSLLKQWISLKF